MLDLLVDTSAFIALAFASDSGHRDALRIQAGLRGKRLRWITTDLFVAEVHAYAQRKWGRRIADSAIANIRNATAEIVFNDYQIGQEALAVLDRYRDVRLSYADAVGIAIAARRRITTVFTLDKAWAAAGLTLA